MKKIAGLLSLLMMSFIGISQDLTPKLSKIDQRSHYCFTVEQAKIIARLLEQKKYKDYLVDNLYRTQQRFELITEKKDSIISFQNIKLINYATVINVNESAMKLFQKKIDHNEKLIKRSKKHKILLGISLLIVGTLVAVK